MVRSKPVRILHSCLLQFRLPGWPPRRVQNLRQKSTHRFRTFSLPRSPPPKRMNSRWPGRPRRLRHGSRPPRRKVFILSENLSPLSSRRRLSSSQAKTGRPTQLSSWDSREPNQSLPDERSACGLLFRALEIYLLSQSGSFVGGGPPALIPTIN